MVKLRVVLMHLAAVASTADAYTLLRQSFPPSRSNPSLSRPSRLSKHACTRGGVLAQPGMGVGIGMMGLQFRHGRQWQEGVGTDMTKGASDSCRDNAPAAQPRAEKIDRKEMQRAFNKMDPQGKGTLGLKEVDGVLDEMGYSELEKVCVLDTLDFNGDGVVTQEEFFRACHEEGAVCAVESITLKKDDVDEKEIMFEFYRRLSLYMRKKKLRDKEVAELMGRKWVDPDDVPEAREEQVEEKARVVSAGGGSGMVRSVGVGSVGGGRAVAGEVAEIQSIHDFDTLVQSAGETPVVVKYFATWCRKCAALKPKYSTLARAYGDKAIFVKMDVENAEAKTRIKERDGVKQIPTFQVWKHNKVVEQYVAGTSIPAVPSALAKLIDRSITGGFSLTSEVDSGSMAAMSSQVVSPSPSQPAEGREGWEGQAGTVGGSVDEKERVIIVDDEDDNKPLINQDAMARFRAAQAAKTLNNGSTRRNPFAK